MHKLIVVTPVYRSEAAIVAECRATVHALRDAGMCVTPEWVIQPGPEVFRNRNRAIRHALSVPGWSHLLTLDADVSLPDPVANVTKLMDAQADIIGGAYTMRWEDGPEVICAARLDRGHVSPTSTGHHLVDWTGGGCVLIRRTALTALAPLWFQHITLPDGTDQTTEDVGFCQHARDMGYDVWIDCSVKAIHHQLNNGGATMVPEYEEISLEEKQGILKFKIAECIKHPQTGIFALQIDLQVANIAGNVKSAENIEKRLADTMKRKSGYEQLLNDLK